MFPNLRLSRHSSPPATSGQAPAAQGRESTRPTPAQGHPELAGRGSPAAGQGAAGLPPRRQLLQRSDALSAHARADAEAAFQRPRVRFEPRADVIQSGNLVDDVTVDFGRKAKPGKGHRPAPEASTSAAAPAPHHEPPKNAQRARAEGEGSKPSIFGSLFRRSPSATAQQPTPPASPGRPQATAATTGPGRSARDTPVDKFNDSLQKFLRDHPDEALKQRLIGHLSQGDTEGFKKEVRKASMVVGLTSAQHLQSMMHSLNRMGDWDHAGIKIHYKPVRPQAAAEGDGTPVGKFNARRQKP
jgi:hypothetical protein